MSLSSSIAAPTDPREQWLESKLIVRSDLIFDVRHNSTSTFVVIEDPVRSKFFQIGLDEYSLLTSLDGHKTLREIAAELDGSDRTTPEFSLQGTTSPPSALNNGIPPEDKLHTTNSQKKAGTQENRVIQIAQWLVQNNLVFSFGVDSSKRLDLQSRMMKRAKVMGWLNPISCKITLFNPNRLLTSIQPYTQWLFSAWVLLIWLAVGGYAMTILFCDWDQMSAATTGVFAGNKWIWMLAIWLILKVVHELGHGIACRRYGGEVPEAGVLLLLFTPMAFVNVTSMWRFPDRWQRIAVAAAGMYVELFISFVSLIVWKYYPGVVGSIAFDVFLMSSVTTILFNANPLMRFDGYFILSDLLNIPNLYTKGTKWFSDRFKALFFGIPKTPNLYKHAERPYVQIYGTLAWFWKLTICFSLIIGASVLFYGAGIILAALGAILWFGIPIFNQVRTLLGPSAPHRINKRRLAISCAVTGLIGLGLFSVLKAPATKSAPAIVQFADEQILRAKADGFLHEILVKDGAAVAQDQVLVVLENPQLALEALELEHLAKEEHIKARTHMDLGELALAQAATQKQESLLKQLFEKREQVESLTVRAPFTGFVYQRELENRLGSFANRGDPILSISRVDTKEIVVSIDQRDLESLKGQEKKVFRVAFPGMNLFPSKLTHINPRASVDPHPTSLGANAGGPLPVKPVTSQQATGESRFELLVPRFTVELSPDAETGWQLASGQRGYAFFDANRQSLGSYLFVAMSEWLESKIEIATQTAAF